MANIAKKLIAKKLIGCMRVIFHLLSIEIYSEMCYNKPEKE